MSRRTNILIATLAAALLAGTAAAAGKDADQIPGSKAYQVRLKLALQKHMAGSLVAELKRNVQVYTALNPQQRSDLREKVYMFKQLEPDRQVDILEAAQEFLNLTAEQRNIYRQRQAWLRRVVSSLSPDEREALRRLTPAERSKRLLELRDKLLAPPPTTQPTTPKGPSVRPTTVPAN